jgi:L-threonylcarbamoyladenylate synthase
MLEHYIEEVPDMAREILSVSDEPLTIVYPGANGLAANLVHEDGSVGIRITPDPFCAGLLHSFRKPIVSTSANSAGQKPPQNFSQIEKVILDAVDYTVNWRREDGKKRKPSGILKVGLDGEIAVIRK